MPPLGRYMLPVPNINQSELIVRKRFNIRTYISTLGLFLPPRIFEIVPADTPISSANCFAVRFSDSIIFANRSRSSILFNSRESCTNFGHFGLFDAPKFSAKIRKLFHICKFLRRKIVHIYYFQRKINTQFTLINTHKRKVWIFLRL